MSQITDKQVERGAAAIYGTGSINGRAVTMSLDDATVTARLVLEAALSTPLPPADGAAHRAIAATWPLAILVAALQTLIAKAQP